MDQNDERDFEEERANEALLNDEIEAGVHDTDGDWLEVTVIGVSRDEGSIVLFDGLLFDDDATEVVFAVDHRPAQGLIYALEQEDDVTAQVEPWQIVRSVKAAH